MPAPTEKRYALRSLFKSVGLDISATKGYPDWWTEERRFGDEDEVFWVHGRGGELVGAELSYEEAMMIFNERYAAEHHPPFS